MKWFQRFRSGDMEVADSPRSSKPVVTNIDRIMEIIELDRHVSTYNIALELKIDQSTVWTLLHEAGIKKKLNLWVPHF